MVWIIYFYQNNIRKILFLRNASRYRSKGNYKVTRIMYIAKLFPDARFIIPVRHPLDHVESLVRQHRLFTGYAETDRRIGKYLETAGHYEFGPQRVPVSLSAGQARRVEEAWSNGQEHLGYAIQWQSVYGYVSRLCENPSLRERLLILRFEDMCNKSADILRDIFKFLGIDDDNELTGRLAERIHCPDRRRSDEQEESMMSVWQEVEPVARGFGYQNP